MKNEKINIPYVKGEKVTGYLPVTEKVSLPYTAIWGSGGGSEKEREMGEEQGGSGRKRKSLLVTAGIHGAEYPGIVAAAELAQELEPDQLCGDLIILHIANPTGFAQRREVIVPEDGENLNRMFPGDLDGSLSQKIAWTITQLQEEADFHADLHSGDIHEMVIPYAYYPGACEAQVKEQAFRIASLLDVEYLVESTARTGAYNSSALRGTPSLLIERGGQGLWSRKEADGFKDDVLRIMRGLGILDTPVSDRVVGRSLDGKDTCTYGYLGNLGREKTVFKSAEYPQARLNGLWFPAVKAGARVTRGQLLGEIKDCFGKVLDQYNAEHDGMVLYTCISLSAVQGDVLAAYGVQ